MNKCVLRALSKTSDWLQGVLRGAQQVRVDELAVGVAGDPGANFSWLEDLRRDVRWLQTQAQNNMTETKAVIKALAVETQDATVQETEVLQTYLVGNRQVLAEKELWMQPIGKEEDEQFDIPTLREAQGLVGELQWL